MRRTVVGCVVAALLLGGGSATAAKLITSKDIKNGTIKLVDMSGSAKTALKGQRGPQGLQGPQGLRGAPGAPGAPGARGPAGINRISFGVGDTAVMCAPDDPNAPDCQEGVSVAVCPTGMVATGGGYEPEESLPLDATVAVSTSLIDGTGWIVVMINRGAAADFYAVAHCVPGSIDTGAAAAAVGVDKSEAMRMLRAAADGAQ